MRDFLMWPLASRIIGKKYENVIKLRNGLKMKTDLGDILGRFVIFYGPKLDYFWEPQTTKLMEVLIKDADYAIDAGAHIGYMALMARRAMKKESRLFSFEPVPYLYKVARENFSLNKDIGEVELERKALSNAEGSVRITIDSLRSAVVADSGGKEAEIVAAISIDEFLRQKGLSKLDFLFLDVEGHESAVFIGMQNLLKRGHPKDIIFEYSSQIKGSLKDLKDYLLPLRGNSYSFYAIVDDYYLRQVGKTEAMVVLYNLAEHIQYVADHHYVNILATKRSKEEIKGLGIKIK